MSDNLEIPRIGTAGWSVPSVAKNAFGKEGSHLERYSSRFPCVEINSSFYRPHRPKTYARWAASAPRDFRFAVKAPRSITHEARLQATRPLLEAFFEQVSALGEALGPILVQLPPSLRFDPAVFEIFLDDFRQHFAGGAVLEPRHPTWFCLEADKLLRSYRVGRVAADPAPVPQAAVPGGWSGFRYWRMHGSPRMYFSAYGEDRLRCLIGQFSPGDWCIFDNTASGAAVQDALLFQGLFSYRRGRC